MVRAFQIAILSCAGLVLTGCNAPEKGEPIWQQVKIGDIAGSHRGKDSVGQPLMTINFVVHLFEIPAENISALDDVWLMLQGPHFATFQKMGPLYTRPLRFNDYDAFGANSFSVGFGQTQMWNKVVALLDAAGGRKIKTISLLLLDGQADDLVVATLGNQQTIFYISTEGSMKGVTVGPGTLALRIKAEKIPGSRGVCNVDVQPVFSPPITSSIPQLAARAKAGELLFSSTGFKLKMGSRDFIFLGPEKYSSDQITLGSLFFSRPGPRPVVRTFLLVCTRINY